MLELFKALADRTRLRLIAILAEGEFTVQELVEVLAMGQSRVSRHLKILLEAGVLQVKREGTWAYYRLRPESALFEKMQPLLAESFAGLEDYVTDRMAVAGVLAARRQRSQSFFDQHAHQWDRMAKDLLPTPDYREQLLEMVPICQRLVEIGVGTGGLLPDLRERSEQVIGVDHSLAMLNAARERMASGEFKGIDLRLGEMERLPLDSDDFNCAVLNMVLHHAAEPAGVIAEVSRVLRPGGVMLIGDLERHEEEWVRDELADQWLGFTRDELRAWCQQNNMKDVSVTPLAGSRDQNSVLLVRAIKQ